MDVANMNEASPGASLEDTQNAPETNVLEDVSKGSHAPASVTILDQSTLFTVAAQLEAELEAFHFVLSSFKNENSRKHKVLLQYGQLNISDPYAALHRDTSLVSGSATTSNSKATTATHAAASSTSAATTAGDGVSSATNNTSTTAPGSSNGGTTSGTSGAGAGRNTNLQSKQQNCSGGSVATTTTSSSSCQDSCLHQATLVTQQPLLFVEELVKTHKRNLHRLGVQILHLEQRYQKALADLEEEKKKHAQDQAVGDDVAYHLEKERDKLAQQVDNERESRKSLEDNLIKIKQLLVNERSRRQSDTVKLLKDRQSLVYKLYNEKKQAQAIKDQLMAETAKTSELNSNLEQLTEQCRNLESAINVNNSERLSFDKQQLEVKLNRSEKQCYNLQEEIARLKERIYELEKGKIPTSDIPEIVESRQPLSQPVQQPRREYAPPGSFHGAVVKLGSAATATLPSSTAAAVAALGGSSSSSASSSSSSSATLGHHHPSVSPRPSPNTLVQSMPVGNPRGVPQGSSAAAPTITPSSAVVNSVGGVGGHSQLSVAATATHGVPAASNPLAGLKRVTPVRYSQEDPNINGNVAHSTIHPFSVKHSSIASNSVSQLSSPAGSAGYPQYQAPPTQFSPNSAGGASSLGAIFSKDSQTPSGGHDFLYVNGSGLSSDMIDGGIGDNPALFMTRKPTGAGSSSTGPAMHSHSLKTLASSLGVAGSRVSPPSELGMFAMAATSPPGPAGAAGVSSNFSSANLSTMSNSSNLTSPLGFSPQSSSLSQQFSSYSQQHSSQSNSSKQLTSSSSSLLSSSSASSSSSSLSSQNTYQNTHAPPPAAFSLAGNLGATSVLGASGVNPLKYRTASGAQSGVVQGYPKYSPGIKPEPPARTSSSLSSHQTAVAAATGVNSSTAGSQ